MKDCVTLHQPGDCRPVAPTLGNACRVGLVLFAACLSAGCGGGSGSGGGVIAPPPPAGGPIAWGPVTTLATNPASLSAPAAAIDGSGLAVVMWGQSGAPLAPAANPYVVGRTQPVGQAWGALERIDTPQSGDGAADALVDLQALAPDTGVLAGWIRSSASGERVVEGRRDGAGWSGLNIAGTLAAQRSELALAANATGVQVAAWSENIGGVRQIVARLKLPGVGSWSPLPAVQSANVAGTQPAVAVDPAGNVLIVWRESNGPTGQLLSRIYNLGSGSFGTVIPLDAAQTDMRAPRVIAYGTNQFLAVWEQANNAIYDLRAKTGNASNWQNASQLVDARAESVGNARLLLAPGVGAFVAWQQGGALYASRWASSTSLWSQPVQVGAGLAGASDDLRVSLSGDRAIAVWTQRGASGVPDLYYAAVSSLGATPMSSGAFALESEAGSAGSPALAVNAGGAAVVSWLQAVPNQTQPNVVARVFRP